MRFIIPAPFLATRRVPKSTVHLRIVRNQFPCNAEDLPLHITDQTLHKPSSWAVKNC